MIDKEQKSIFIMVYIYEDGISGIEVMNGCMVCFVAEYLVVKFCRVKSSVIGVSSRFIRNVFFVLLIYKGGELIGNFVRVIDQLGEDFFVVDFEVFLQEFGLFLEKEILVLIFVRNFVICYSEDSDLEID